MNELTGLSDAEVETIYAAYDTVAGWEAKSTEGKRAIVEPIYRAVIQARVQTAQMNALRDQVDPRSDEDIEEDLLEDGMESNVTYKGLRELRELSEAASPGPWQYLDSGGDPDTYDELQDGNGEMVASGFREDIVFDGKPLNRDGSFAAAAVNYVRAALAAEEERA